MNAHQKTRIEADRQIEELLSASTQAERERIEERGEQGRQWRQQMIELEREIGQRRGSRGHCPIINDGTVGVYEQ